MNVIDPRLAPALEKARELGLLAQRIGAGLLIWTFHMRPKLLRFDEELREFPDPLGIGAPASLALALLSEGLCSVLVALGLLTRLAALPVVFTMLMVLTMAARGFEGADVQSALLYALPYATLVATGPGRYSCDHRLLERYRRLYARFIPPRA